MARTAGATLLLIALLSACGCQTRATLRETRVVNGATQSFTSSAAYFFNGPNQRQNIVLAFQPTGAEQPTSVRREGPTLPGLPDRPADRAMLYRAYLMLEVQSGGGQFKIGDRLIGGRVRAFYRVYNERGEIALEAPDRYGEIRTDSWMLTGGSPDDWWVSGSYDLLMANDLKLTGRFLARPSEAFVTRYLKEKRL